MRNSHRIAAILPAAGSGSRLGAVRPKQFIELAGKSILLRSLEAFQYADEVDEILVSVAGTAVEHVRRLVEANRLNKVLHIVAGGPRRQDSVWNALQKLEGSDVRVVLIHDAARPFVSAELIRSVCEAAETFGAAIPALPVTDTIKRVSPERFIDGTIDRSTLAMAQTPQGFRLDILLNAFRAALKDSYTGTDEASLLEHLGMRVKIIAGEKENMKITDPEDLAAAALIADRLDHPGG